MRVIVYACSHERWLSESIRSARSCEKLMRGVKRIIYLTPELYKNRPDVSNEFAEVHVVGDLAHDHRPRFEAMLRCAYDEALFIDGDTLLVEPVHELFDILKYFDVGLAIAPQYFHPEAIKGDIYSLFPSISFAIPEFNSGVIVARVDDAFRKMVSIWSEFMTLSQNKGYQMDQPALRSARVVSKLRIATLPSIYNFRAMRLQTVGGRVRILHAHGDLGQIASRINVDTKNRLFKPRLSETVGFFPPSL